MKPSQSTDSLDERISKVSQCNIKQFKSYLTRLKNRYGYDQFMDVGFACYNNFDGSSKGFGVWLEWVTADTTTHDHDRDIDYLNIKWKSMNSDRVGPIVDWRTMKKWADEDTPINPYEELYNSGGRDALINELNTGELVGNKLGYCNMTSEFIIQTPEGWMLKNENQARTHFECYNFIKEDEEDEGKSFQVKPFMIWRGDIRRNTFHQIVFDPSGQETGSYNLWRGYKITEAVCQSYDESDCQVILDHIFNIWADGDPDRYEYILNWFAWKLQKPDKKMAVVICLNSGEGAGKNIILNHLYKIMGSNYDSISSAKSILGDFNGVLEARTLINFDEVTYGGNHEKNNQLKSLISEDYVFINKKNKEMYRIRAMADFIITTNEEYFIGVNGDSRRYCPMSLNRRWEGVQTDESEAYFNKIRDAPSEAFAKFLYNRDISNFNPRKFKKTLLFQQQVEKSWCSVIRWLYQALESGHLYQANASKFIHWCKLPPSNHQTDFQWEVYGSQSFDNQDYSGMKKIAFMKNGQRWYRTTKLYDIYTGCRQGSYAKVVTEQVFNQKLKEVFDVPTKSHPKLGMCCKLPELDDARLMFNKWAKWDYDWCGNEGCFDSDEDDIEFTEEWEQDEEKDAELLKKKEEKEKECHL